MRTDACEHADERARLTTCRRSSSLVAFESAARHLSFTRAGDEIALTQSAVSRQIAGARRAPRRAAVPPPAPRAARSPTTARTLLRARSSRRSAASTGRRASSAHSERAKTVVVTTTPGFAGLWLIPRLAGFIAAHPGVDVRISAEQRSSSTSSATASTSPSATGRSDARPATACACSARPCSPVCSPRLLRAAASAAASSPPTCAATCCCTWSPTAATSCRTGASGCTR